MVPVVGLSGWLRRWNDTSSPLAGGRKDIRDVTVGQARQWMEDELAVLVFDVDAIQTERVEMGLSLRGRRRSPVNRYDASRSRARSRCCSASFCLGD